MLEACAPTLPRRAVPAPPYGKLTGAFSHAISRQNRQPTPNPIQNAHQGFISIGREEQRKYKKVYLTFRAWHSGQYQLPS